MARNESEGTRHDGGKQMMSRLVTSIATLCLLALGAGAAAIAAIAWPERQLEATFVSASLLALTIAFARRLQQSLTFSR